MQRWGYAAALVLFLGAPAHANTKPTPEPSDAASFPPELAPVGDAGVVVTPTTGASSGAAPVQIAATPTPVVDETYAAGTAELTVWICVDADRNERCSHREGVAGVPFEISDATTGAMVSTGMDAKEQRTGTDGRRTIQLTLRERTRVVVDLPLLAVSVTANQEQGGVTVVIPPVTAPRTLP
jgi:hypothetical protein